MSYLDVVYFLIKDRKNTLKSVEVDKWLNKNKDIKSIILVSSYYHLPRSIMILKKN